MSSQVEVMRLPELPEDIEDDKLKLGTMFARHLTNQSHREENYFTDENECLEWFRREAERHEWKLIKVTFDGKVIYQVFDEHSSPVRQYRGWEGPRKYTRFFYPKRKCIVCGETFQKNSNSHLICSKECNRKRKAELSRKRYWLLKEEKE